MPLHLMQILGYQFLSWRLLSHILIRKTIMAVKKRIIQFKRKNTQERRNTGIVPREGGIH